jgi:hypothetical protein
MLTNLVIASVLLFGCSSSIAETRRPMKSDVLFEIEQRTKADVELTEYEFQLEADGTWTYVETMKQAIQKRGAGKLSPQQLATVRDQLARAEWKVTTLDMTCMAYAAQFKQYIVDGAPVWKEEMCSGESLDAKSADRLARVMAIVTPLIATK